MTRPIETFLAIWIEEFGRAIGMFSGARPSIVPTPIATLPETDTFLWYRQSLSSSAGSFVTWIGACEVSWSALGSTDADNPQAAYLQVVNQAQSSTATIASRGLENPITADASEIASDAGFDSSSFYLYSLAIDGNRLPALVLAIEKAAEQVLPEGNATKLKNSAVSNTPAVPESLLDLELPVAISLGYAELPIKSVLNVKPGMPIELSTENGEDLELLVHGTVIARGEITMVKGNYALKIKQIVGAEDRLSLLKR